MAGKLAVAGGDVVRGTIDGRLHSNLAVGKCSSWNAMRRLVLKIVVVLNLVVFCSPTYPAPAGQDIAVHAQKDGSTFEVDVQFTVAASTPEVWEVFTDFDHAAEFLSNVDTSRVVNRAGNVLQVSQTSHANAGLLRITLDNLREVELIPNREIHSRLLKGDLKMSEFTTRLVDEGSATRVSVHGKFALGGLAASALTVEATEAQTRRQYQELRSEALRRKAHEPRPPCLATKTCPQGGD